MYERSSTSLKDKRVKDILVRSGMGEITEGMMTKLRVYQAMVLYHGLAVVYQRTEQQDAGTD